MTTNEQRAAEVIHRTPLTTGRLIQRQHAKLFARALADAGLLMSDLPAPDEDGTWEAGDHILTVEDGRIHYRDAEGYITGSATPQVVREEALAWLAAAQHAETEGEA